MRARRINDSFFKSFIPPRVCGVPTVIRILALYLHTVLPKGKELGSLLAVYCTVGTVVPVQSLYYRCAMVIKTAVVLTRSLGCFGYP